MSNDIYQDVTNNIISILDKVDRDDYQAPFAGLANQGIPLNPTTEQTYNGINILSLWFNQQARKFTSNQWATFKQWKQHGAQVERGERGSRIIFYKTLKRTETDNNGEESEVSIPMLRTYTVFNANQVKGYEDEATLSNSEDQVEPIQAAEQFCMNTKADIRTGENRAYYHLVEDYINMPETSAFMDTDDSSATENYYATLFHELSHWTGAKHRLNREKAQSRKELKQYAIEELVAELGAAFLCAQLGITQSPRKDHALYIKSWLLALHNDNKFIFTASAQAARAAEYLNELQSV